MKNTRLLQSTKTLLATVAITGLMAGAAARVQASTGSDNSASQFAAAKGQLVADDSAGKHSCKGQNSCKGQGGCKTGDNGCKGQNTCKGKGGCKTNGTA